MEQPVGEAGCYVASFSNSFHRLLRRTLQRSVTLLSKALPKEPCHGLEHHGYTTFKTSHATVRQVHSDAKHGSEPWHG
jgi:hypothetical protein